MESKLKVQNLVISFRTASGKLQAVRDVSFDLYKGETLAIVGESGSGKSVTSRAIMGILANNAIVEGGKILYGDKDLLKISEEEFHRLRGDKIAMVFQDPLSSLNPIMRVGKQLTEAMILKNKASRRESKANMKEMFDNLEKYMAAVGEGNSIHADIEKFKKFEEKHCELESAYQNAKICAQEVASLSQNLLLRIQKNSWQGVSADVKELSRAAKGACSRFVISKEEAEVRKAADELPGTYQMGRKEKEFKKVFELLTIMRNAAEDALKAEEPNMFALGYWLTFVDGSIPEKPVSEINKAASEKLNADFLDGFLKKIEKAVRYSAGQADQGRKEALAIFEEKLPLFKEKLLGNEGGKSEADVPKDLIKKETDALKAVVLKGIDPLEVELDSVMHTFGTSMDYALDLYFTAGPRNAAEKKRYETQLAKYNKMKESGKELAWEVVPASYIDMDAAREGVTDIIAEMITHLKAKLALNEQADFGARTAEIVEYLKQCAAESAYKVSRQVAKEKAIKLMEGVGIDEPRRRFYQYPFEFSGGMRQRVVIAIALTADPDVLICDEPTTALDVTIQAQILELINNLKKERNLSVIFITHDLGVVANMADRVAVMYAGKIVETGTAEDIFYRPAHPYTWALLSSVPDLDTKDKLESIPGTPPNMIYPPVGDAFADRNKYALEIDFEKQPPMFQISETHYAATWLLHPNAPKLEVPAIIKARIEKMRKNGKGDTDGQE